MVARTVWDRAVGVRIPGLRPFAIGGVENV